MAKRTKRRMKKRSAYHRKLTKARLKVKKRARRKIGYGARKRRAKKSRGKR